MTEMTTVQINEIHGEVGGEAACLVTCIGGCAAAELVVPGGATLAAFATAASAL